MPASTALGEQIVFLQESTVWDETTWERGFVQRKEHLGHNSEKHNSPDCAISALQYKTSDLNREPEEQRAFSVTWERIGESVFKGESKLYIWFREAYDLRLLPSFREQGY